MKNDSRSSVTSGLFKFTDENAVYRTQSVVQF